MARKKSGNAAGNGVLFVIVLIGGAIASIPKSAWVAMGVVVAVGAIIGGITWLVARRAPRQSSQPAPSPHITQANESNLGLADKKDSISFSLSEVTSPHGTHQAESEFYRVQLNANTLPEFRIPEPAHQTPKARWMPAGESFTISGLSIPGGMLYVGEV